MFFIITETIRRKKMNDMAKKWMKNTCSMQFLLVAFITLFFVGCEVDATVDPPAFEKKPVVMSYISTKDTGIRVKIAYTQAYYGKVDAPIEYIRDAEVWVVDITDKDSIKLGYRLSEESYWVDSSRYRVQSKHEYRLNVLFTDGKFTQAVCKVPDVNRATNWQIVDWAFVIDTGSMAWSPYSWRLSMQCNNPESGFYYQPMFDLVVEDPATPWQYSFFESRSWGDPGQSLLGTEGVVLPVVDRGTTYDPIGGGNIIQYQLKGVSLISWVYDKYFQFHYLAQFSDDSNPFAEPVLLHGNMTNNILGVFSAYDFNELMVMVP